MATVKVTLDTRKNCQDKDGKFPLVLRIGHKRKTRDISFDIHLLSKQLNSDTGEIKGIVNAVRQTKRTQKIYRDIDFWLDENRSKIKLWTVEKLKDELSRVFFDKQITLSLLSHGAKYLYRLMLEGRFSTAKSYEDALKAFIKYRMKRAGRTAQVIIKTLFGKTNDGLNILEDYQKYDMPIKAIDSEFVKDYKAHMTNQYGSKNTVGIYLRSLNAIINDASESYPELKGHNPMARIKKGSFENAPVVLSIQEINEIRALRFLQENPKYDVRNYFLFMFNNMGMNFYDLALIKVFQFDGERIKYFREKTKYEGDYFSIKQNDESLKIIDDYINGKQADDFLFPILSNDIPQNKIFRVKNDKLKRFNKHLKEIAQLAGIKKKISSYSARDTWTNIGLDLGIDIRQISSGLGHSSIEVTEKHYGKTIQEKILDEINARITVGA